MTIISILATVAMSFTLGMNVGIVFSRRLQSAADSKRLYDEIIGDVPNCPPDMTFGGRG